MLEVGIGRGVTESGGHVVKTHTVAQHSWGAPRPLWVEVFGGNPQQEGSQEVGWQPHSGKPRGRDG